MAENIVKFKVDSSEYEQKIKRASQSIQDYARQCQASGQSMAKADQNAVKFAGDLGRMETVCTSTSGSLSEMKKAFVELTVQYNKLSEEEKKSPFGKSLSQSLDQLKQRVIDGKNELDSINESLQNIEKNSGAFDKLNGALQVFAGNMLTNVAESIKGTITQSIELAKESEGVENAFARLNRPDLLNNLKEATHGTVSEFELMKAAVKFDDFKLPVEELGTMLAFAQQKAKDTGQSIDYMVDSIVTGLGRKSLMILDNLGLSAAEVKEKMKETGDMTVAVGEIIREQMSKSGGYVETASDIAARAAANQDNAMRKLGKSLQPIAGVVASVFATFNSVVAGTIGIIVKYKNVLIVAASAAGGYAVAANASAIATGAYTVATKIATVAQRTFNTVVKANPIGLFVAGLAAGVSEILSFGDALSGESQREKDQREVQIRQMERERAERERVAKKAQEEASVISSSASEKISKYKLLQDEWVKLSNEQQKNTFIKNNATAFEALGVSIKTSADAMKFFVSNADKVIKALDAMAKAEALKDLLKDAYKKQYETGANGPDRSSYKVSTAEMRLLTPANLTTNRGTKSGSISSHISNFISSQPELLAAGITNEDYRYNSTYGNMSGGQMEFHMNVSGIQKLEEFRKSNAIKKAADEASEDVNRLQDAFNTAVYDAEKLKSDAGVFGGGGNKSGKGSITLPKGSVAALEKQLSDIKKQQTLATSTTEWESYNEKIREVTLSIKELKGELNEAGGMLSQSVFKEIMGDKVMKTSITDLANKNIKKTESDLDKRRELLSDPKNNKPIKIEIPKQEKREVKMTDAMGQMASGMSSVVSGIESLGIEIPEGLKNVISGIQAVTSILSGIATIVTAIQAITAADAIVPFAHGGIVGRAAGGMVIPGTSFSGDRLRMPVVDGGMIGVNSGEVILNRAQTNNLASALEGGGQQIAMQPYVDGEKIFLGMNNTSKRMGRGEIVTTGMLRRLGLM